MNRASLRHQFDPPTQAQRLRQQQELQENGGEDPDKPPSARGSFAGLKSPHLRPRKSVTTGAANSAAGAGVAAAAMSEPDNLDASVDFGEPPVAGDGKQQQQPFGSRGGGLPGMGNMPLPTEMHTAGDLLALVTLQCDLLRQEIEEKASELREKVVWRSFPSWCRAYFFSRVACLLPSLW